MRNPTRDLAQQRLMAGIATRFAQPGTTFIPGTVRYTLAGYDSAGPDPAEGTLQERWEGAVGRAEGATGITMAAIRKSPAPATPPSWSSYRPGPAGCWPALT